MAVRRRNFYRTCLLWAVVLSLLIFVMIGVDRPIPTDYFFDPDIEQDEQQQQQQPTAEEIGCKFPQLLVDDPLIRKHFVDEKPLVCNKEKNWIYVDNGVFYIDNDAERRHGEIQCDLLRITRLDDDRYWLSEVENVRNDTPLLPDMDMFRAECESADGNVYENLHCAVPIPYAAPPPPPPEAAQALNVSVLIYLLDSVSRMHFMRKLPNFYRHLTQEAGAYVMEGYNIVGDSTTAALIPLTTGHFQTELPEARKRHRNASQLDDWPLVFKDFERLGYVTTYLEEQAWTNAFHMRLRGFARPPTTHFLRPLLIAVEDNKRLHHKYCLGDTPESIVWLEFFRQLQRVHRPRNVRHFSIMFTSETSHDHYNLVQSLDEHLTNKFAALRREGMLNDTLLLVMSDHGHRHVITRRTQTGKWEERLPFLAVVPPPWFCSRYPRSCRNLAANRQRLVTAFDLHQTLQHLLRFDAPYREPGVKSGTKPGSESGSKVNFPRGISLFERIPVGRTCADAAISAHFCSCLEWTEIPDPTGDPLTVAASQFAVQRFNQLTNNDLPGVCANLTVKRIVSAQLLQPNAQLMAFKESLDIDNFIPDLSDNRTASAIIYQLRFISDPGEADWEISVTYFVELGKFAMSTDAISRLNRYHDQARCVIDQYPHLRMFCYCLRDKL